MEGVIDAAMRDLLTAVGGYDACVTEFLRISDGLLPERVFRRHFPELEHGACTSAGTPVILQLLGGDARLMAENAARGVELGAPAIDLNFGCPSKTVNRHDGGAVLLKAPERLRAIVTAVRAALPPAVPLSAKLRLGYDDSELALDNARAAVDGGASCLTVHARTRADGYRAPARWEQLAAIREAVPVPLVANGDIRSAADYVECRRISGCEDAMLGRGAVARPDLARAIRAGAAGAGHTPLPWSGVAGLLQRLQAHMVRQTPPEKVVPRLKQWLAMLAHAYPEAHALFGTARTERDPERFQALLDAA